MPLTLESPSAAVERALSMLEAVSQDSEGLTNAEISRKLQIPKSSASYILRTLEKRGYLNRDSATGKYRVGLKVLSLSRGALSGIDVRAQIAIVRSLMNGIASWGKRAAPMAATVYASSVPAGQP